MLFLVDYAWSSKTNANTDNPEPIESPLSTGRIGSMRTPNARFSKPFPRQILPIFKKGCRDRPHMDCLNESFLVQVNGPCESCDWTVCRKLYKGKRVVEIVLWLVRTWLVRVVKNLSLGGDQGRLNLKLVQSPLLKCFNKNCLPLWRFDRELPAF